MITATNESSPSGEEAPGRGLIARTPSAGSNPYRAAPSSQCNCLGPGETIILKRGVGHRWWNAAATELRCTGWATPPNNLEYFLTALFDSMKRSGRQRPGFFDAAFLLTRYRSEIHMLDIPAVVQKGGVSSSFGRGDPSREVRQIQRRARAGPGNTRRFSSFNASGLTAHAMQRSVTAQSGGRVAFLRIASARNEVRPSPCLSMLCLSRSSLSYIEASPRCIPWLHG